MQAVKFEEIETSIANQQDDGSKDSRRNYLMEAAIPLFNRASQMKFFQSGLPTLQILNELRQEVERFENTAEEYGMRYETVKAARYCLCTLLDEFAAKNGWADQEWAAHSLLVTFHNETWGGEQFFELLDKIKAEPSKNLNLIELMYYCLVVGYMGKYQVINNGRVTVENLKKDLEKIIRQYRTNNISHLLSDGGHVNVQVNNRRRALPFWVALVLAITGLALTHTYLNWKLAQTTSNINTRVQALDIPQVIAKPAEKTTLLAPYLKNEIASGLIQVSEVPGKTTITILGDELFASGSDKIEDRFYPVLAAVSQALNNVNGQVIVSGYTDDQPISSPVYPSNWHLSQGRADAVKAILLNYIKDETRVRSEGKGVDNPVVPNDSAANRAKNRRVEITVYIEPGSRKLEQTPGVVINNEKINN
jgi:type VI secretion system protein ImpK